MPRFRSAMLPLAFVLLTTGCQTAMSTQTDTIQPPPETLAVPLKFAVHNFGAACYNTLSCSVVYNHKQFAPFSIDKPSPPPPSPDYRKNWDAGFIGIENFPSPAIVQWTSLDGAKHESKVDMAKIFKEQLIWHKVPKSDMADFYSGPVAGEPDIFLEVNDHAINVFMWMLIPTKTEQVPGNKLSYGRDDRFLVWTHTY
ncbi:hypothetical protein [Rhodanobacter sp. DHB23]|uniref:hypothetical protein n=1 Tax=Rhodanobacter sp. DHB23 TaxID=2775923 RepID=UPI00177FBADA|nr:hypothetical protein [Rhodanobacter sp. DHB23]MBD8872209.1 hypothetical protein [Rhodanobacter sp. DHB23]